jgi:hypothetical protein
VFPLEICQESRPDVFWLSQRLRSATGQQARWL